MQKKTLFSTLKIVVNGLAQNVSKFLLKMNETRSPKLFMGTGLVFGVSSMILNVLSFSTPYWLQVWPRVGDTTFRNLGLWQVCISGFRDPKYPWGKVYHGCWWIFAREYTGLRDDGVILPRN